MTILIFVSILYTKSVSKSECPQKNWEIAMAEKIASGKMIIPPPKDAILAKN